MAATATTYTVTATGNSGTIYAGGTQTTTLSVRVNSALGTIAYTDTSPLSVTARAATGTAITNRTITAPTPAAHTDLTYSISPNLTANTGLSFDTTNGTISGTPSIVAATATTYTVTATGNSGTSYAGATRTTTLSVQVNPAAFSVSYVGVRDTPGSFLPIAFISMGTGKDGATIATAYEVTVTTGYTNVRLSSTSNPSGAKGTGTNLATFSITPDVQAKTGLRLETATDATTPAEIGGHGRIAGDPSVVDTSGTLYTITITGAAGTIHAGREVNVYLKITVTNP